MFDLNTLTTVHTVVSLISLAVGFGVIAGLIASKPTRISAPLFLATALFTSVSGFLFPVRGLTPALVVGVIALVVLALVFAARARSWRKVYAAGMVLSVYFLAFVTVAQAFAKIPPLKALAPTQSEPPFAAAHGVVLLLFVLLGVLATRSFGRKPAAAA